MLEGTSIELYTELSDKFPDLEIIASGGITAIEELYKLDELGLSGAIIGKAIYEGKIKLEELKRFIVH